MEKLFSIIRVKEGKLLLKKLPRKEGKQQHEDEKEG
jgi:hypothetical protein